MKKKTIIILILFLLFFISLVFALYFIKKNTNFLTFNIPEQEINDNNQNEVIDGEKFLDLKEHEINGQTLNLPEGFEISIYANSLNSPRDFTFNDSNSLIVSDIQSKKIFLLPDNNNDGKADQTIEIDKNFKNPHGIDFYEGDLYLADENQVFVYRDLTNEGKFSKKEILIKNLPTGGHVTRTIKIGPDKKIYLTVGSSCNLCEESDKRRAALVRYNLDGTGQEIFAEGLRNTVDFIFKNSGESFEIWGVDNGRDLIGDNLPPEEVNIIAQGKHYGWPYCYGDRIANPEYPEKDDFCKNQTTLPKYNMQAHSAPLGLTFIPENGNFPEELKDNLIVAFHGSWNRTVPTGYKVVRIDTNASEPKVIDFITGWLQSDGESWGRPVGVEFDKNGDLFLSDDKSGLIYKITYTANDSQ